MSESVRGDEHMLTKQCPRCRKIIPFGMDYCEECQPIKDEQREQFKAKRTSKYNKQRDPKYKQFYMTREWQILRSLKLQQTGYLCEECKTEGLMAPAEDVHHVIPISMDWDKRLDINNLKCLCVKHHNLEHDRFKSKSVS